MSNDSAKMTSDETQKIIEKSSAELQGDVIKPEIPLAEAKPEPLKAAATASNKSSTDDPNIIKISKDQLQTLINGNNNFMALVFASMDTIDAIQTEISNLNAKVINMKEGLKRVIRGEPMQPVNQNNNNNQQNQPQPQPQQSATTPTTQPTGNNGPPTTL